MGTFSKRFFRAAILVTSVFAVTATGLPQTAEAGIFRFLLGGGGGNPQNRDWTNVTSRQLVRFTTAYEPGTVVVSFADRRLYYVQSTGQALSYLIGTPVLEEKWSGVLNVSDKREHPRWVPTPDMRRKDPTLPDAVEGGDPRNPLGPRALYLGDTLYRIHGTDAPWTVGHEVSNGCVRLYNRDILDLYSRVPVGAKVVVTWERFDHIASLPVPQQRERTADSRPWQSSELTPRDLR
jgi:lipoprotein-anchoring transpeptidase ErfK/SrfK